MLCCLIISSCGGSSDSPASGPIAPIPPAPIPDPVPEPTPAVSCGTDKQIRINEAVASNSEFTDQDGDSSDWFELYNCTDWPIEMLGWTLSDDIDEPDQWTMPAYTLDANSYLLLWASNKDRDTEELHTNFKISTKGETLYLYDNTGTQIDALLVENVPADSSIGISSDNQLVVYYAQPTPNAANDTESNLGSVSQTVEYSHPGGPVTSLALELSGQAEDQTIYYTTDSTEPNVDSLVYTQGIPVYQNTVVRARIYQPDYLPSRIHSRSYLVGTTHDLPIVALVTEADNFFDEQTGIYTFGSSFANSYPYFGANFWQDIEKPINVSLFERDGSLGINFDAGVKIFGGWSRAQAQRSLSVFARGQYGFSEIDYPIFPDLAYDEYQTFVLRNAGQDWSKALIRDGLMTKLMAGSGLEVQAHRPVVAYINNQYWGIYNLREKINEHFIASKFGFDTDEIDIVEQNSETIHGDNNDYIELISYLSANSLVNSQEYNSVAARVDINNYIIYQIAQIFFNNTDWPGNNIKYWKHHEGKWRWILFDTDFGFNNGIGIGSGPGAGDGKEYLHDSLAFALEENGPDWPNPPWSTLLFRRLMENQQFKNQFISQFSDELNSRFLPDNGISLIDNMAANIAAEMPAHIERWKDDNGLSLSKWESELERLREFSRLRPANMWAHIQNQFQLEEIHTLTVNITDPAQGSVSVNSLTTKLPTWQGNYFESIPVTLIAQPSEGFTFSHWQGTNDAITTEIELILEQAVVVSPVFVAQ